MQTDGNLVMYRSDGQVRFATYKYGQYAVMQGDGNFVEYSSSNQALWNTYTAGNIGSYLAVQDDGNLVVYSSSNVPLWNIGVDPDYASSSVDPRYAGDVVGRDLAVIGLGWIGHVGIWDGGRIVEAGPDSGSGNAIHMSSLSDFKSRSTYWGTASAKIPAYDVWYCFATRCTNFYRQPWGEVEKASTRIAIAKRAYQSYLIGADYTLSADYLGTSAGDYYHPATRGVYRCDGFVLDSLGVTVWNYNSYNEPIDSTWSSRYQQLLQPPRLPRTIFNQLKTFN